MSHLDASAPPTAGSTYRRTTPTLLQALKASVWRTLRGLGTRRARRPASASALRRVAGP